MQDMRARINADEFTTKLPFPSREEGDGPNDYKRRLEAYRADKVRLEMEFRRSLEIVYGDPKWPVGLFNVVYVMACWDNGHCLGLLEILDHYDTFASLTRLAFIAGADSHEE